MSVHLSRHGHIRRSPSQPLAWFMDMTYGQQKPLSRSVSSNVHHLQDLDTANTTLPPLTSCRLSHAAPDRVRRKSSGDFSPNPLICLDQTPHFAQVGLTYPMFGMEIQNAHSSLLLCSNCRGFALHHASWPSGIQGLRHVAALRRDIGPHHEKQPSSRQPAGSLIRCVAFWPAWCARSSG